MRGFLILLACAFVVMLASPFFWSLVRMEASAERVGYTHADGVTQWAWLGPAAPWPDWAPAPERARMRVQSNFEAAPGMPAIGMANVDFDIPTREALALYAKRMEAAGWSVTQAHLDTATPDLPPRRLRLCFVEARQDMRLVRLTLENGARRGAGTLQWIQGQATPMIGAVAGGC
jgi:hypothetical protein